MTRGQKFKGLWPLLFSGHAAARWLFPVGGPGVVCMCSVLDFQSACAVSLRRGPSGLRWSWLAMSEVGGAKSTAPPSERRLTMLICVDYLTQHRTVSHPLFVTII